MRTLPKVRMALTDRGQPSGTAALNRKAPLSQGRQRRSCGWAFAGNRPFALVVGRANRQSAVHCPVRPVAPLRPASSNNWEENE